MLHELLLALLGLPGQVLTMSSDRTGYRVAPELDFISPAETAQLQRLLKIAASYRRLQQRHDTLLRVCAVSGIPTESILEDDDDDVFADESESVNLEDPGMALLASQALGGSGRGID